MKRMARALLLLLLLSGAARTASSAEPPEPQAKATETEPWQRDWREFGKFLGKLAKKGERTQGFTEPFIGKSVEWEGTVEVNSVRRGSTGGSLWLYLGRAEVPPEAAKPAEVKVWVEVSEQGRDAWVPVARPTRVIFRAVLGRSGRPRDAAVVLANRADPDGGASLVVVTASEGVLLRRLEPEPAPAITAKTETKPETGAVASEPEAVTPGQDGVGSGKAYRIWREEEGTVKSFKLNGLGPVPLSALAIPLEFEVNPGMEPEAFEVRMKIVTVDPETKKPTEITTTVASQGQEPGARRGRTRGLFLPTKEKLKGKGQVTVYLVKESDKSRPDATPMSNALVVPVEIE